MESTSLTTDREGSPLVEYLRQPPPMYAVLLNGPWGVGKSYFWADFVRNELPGLDRVSLTISAAGLSTLEELERALFTASIQKMPGAFVETTRVLWKMGLRWVKVDPTDITLKADLKTDKTVVCIDDIERFSGAFEVLFGFIVSLVDDAKLHVVLIADESKNKGKYFEVKEKIVGRTIRIQPDISKFYTGAVRSIGDTARKSRDALEAFRAEAISLLESKKVENLRTVRGIVSELDLILRSLKWPDGHKADITKLFSAVVFHILATAKNAENDAIVAKIFSTKNIVMTMRVRESVRGRPGRKPVEGEGDDNMDKIKTLIDDLSFSQESLGWPQSDAFASLVVGGKVDAQAIASDFQVFLSEKDGGLRPLNRLQYRDRMSEEDFAKSVAELEVEIRGQRFATLSEMWMSFEILYGLSLNHLTRFTPDECVEFFLSSLDGFDDSSIQDTSIYIYPAERSEGEKQVMDKLQAMALKVAPRIEAKFGNVILDKAISGTTEILDAGRKGVFAGTTTESLFDRLREAGWVSIQNLDRFVAARSSVDHTGKAFADEAPFAYGMSKLIAEQIKEKRPMTMAESALMHLGSQFERFAKKIDPETDS